MKWCTNLKWHRRGALLLFKVIRQISRSHGIKNCRFWPQLGVSGLKLWFEFTDRFEMMHKAWCSIEDVPYYFSRSSIKFQGHTGWKINDLDQIWVRLLGRSQLLNPSDLPCFIEKRKSWAHLLFSLIKVNFDIFHLSEPLEETCHQECFIFIYRYIKFISILPTSCQVTPALLVANSKNH